MGTIAGGCSVVRFVVVDSVAINVHHKSINSLFQSKETVLFITCSRTSEFRSFVTSIRALDDSVASVVDGDALTGCMTLELVSTARPTFYISRHFTNLFVKYRTDVLLGFIVVEEVVTVVGCGKVIIDFVTGDGVAVLITTALAGNLVIK